MDDRISAYQLPCYAGVSPAVIMKELEDRFFLHLDDAACISKIDELFEHSLNNYKTVMYDRFQKLTNGIS